MTGGIWQLRVPTGRRPTTMNELRRLHWSSDHQLRTEYRDLAFFAARRAGLPRLEQIVLIARGVYADAKALPDTDAIAPTVKGIIDGLVLAKLVPDDTAAHIRRISYDPPVRDTWTGVELMIEDAA